MSEKKQKYAYWMRPSMVAEIEEMLPTANATSKGDFVCKAVEFYIGYLRQQKNINYLAPMLARVVKSEVRSLSKDVCEMLFKLAVELGINSNITAAVNDISDADQTEKATYASARTVAGKAGTRLAATLGLARRFTKMYLVKHKLKSRRNLPGPLRTTKAWISSKPVSIRSGSGWTYGMRTTPKSKCALHRTKPTRVILKITSSQALARYRSAS